MGARERTRAAIRIPGSRPAGVFTAGVAQRLVNLQRRTARTPGGDPGLRRHRADHGPPPDPRGGGGGRGVRTAPPRQRPRPQRRALPGGLRHPAAPVDHGGGDPRTRPGRVGSGWRPSATTCSHTSTRPWDVACDTLLVSVGLIPDNELAHRLRLRTDPVTSGPVVSSQMETSLNGVFACGQRRAHPRPGRLRERRGPPRRGESPGATPSVTGRLPDDIALQPGANVAYCVPQSVSSGRRAHRVPAGPTGNGPQHPAPGGRRWPSRARAASPLRGARRDGVAQAPPGHPPGPGFDSLQVEVVPR